MSELFRHYGNYYFVYVIDISTHVLLLFNYYIFVPFAQFWSTGRFKKLIDCRFIWHSVVIFQVKTHNISKGKWDILEILILLFDLSYLDVELLQHGSTYTNSTAFIFIIVFLLRISHNFNNRDQNNFDLLFQRLFLCLLRLNRTLWKPRFIFKGRALLGRGFIPV